MYQNDLGQIIMSVEEFKNIIPTELETVEGLIELYGAETTLMEVVDFLKEQEEHL